MFNPIFIIINSDLFTIYYILECPLNNCNISIVLKSEKGVKKLCIIIKDISNI